MVRREECEFSHFAVHPGHGRRYVPFAFISTKPVLTFSRPKCFSLYLRKKNPRFIAWTHTYRRLHKKHAEEGKARRRTRKVTRAPRAIIGADLPLIQERRAAHKKQDTSAKGAAVRAEIKARKQATKK
jgi:large subunit ribosomal protein L24e